MSDVIYVLLTLVVFVLLALLVGLLDRLTGDASQPRFEATAEATAGDDATNDAVRPVGSR